MHRDSSKLKAIIEAPVPTNQKELQSFIGLANYYNRYIRNFSTVFEPLFRLLRKDVKFVWGKDQQKCFNLVKKLFQTDIVLRSYDQNLPTVIECDASSYGIASALFQQHVDGWRPVAFVSRSLNADEKRYSQLERECLAIVFGCEKFRKFLLGGKFIVQSDHNPLKKLLGSTSAFPQTCSARVQRWALRLSQFDYDVQYVRGVEMLNSDCMSRLPLAETEPINEPQEVIYLL